MAATMKSEEREPWHPFWAWSLGVLVLATLGIRFAEPVRDGDLWWQMAYGRWLIEHRTLVPDHTAFTWTPSESPTIYCAWLPEILLHLLYKAGGLPLLFAFRYGCLLLFVLAFGYHARRSGALHHPLSWLICLLGVLMSQNAAYIKPEIFSYVLMTLTVLVWLRIKAAEGDCRLTCYLFPVLALVWVNSHGGFLFGAAFLCVIGVGEALNVLFSPARAVSPRVRRHFFFALALSGPAMFATPYGWRYPGYLLTSLLGKEEGYFQVIEAYLSTLDPRAAHFHYAVYMVLAGLLLLAMMARDLRRGRPDWAILLASLAFGFLYTRFLRATYFWAPVFSLSAVHLLAARPGWAWPGARGLRLAMGSAVALGCLFLGGRAGFDAVCKPYGPRWLGFGISYMNPVEEAEFIRTRLSAYRLGNDYTSGGYLLWALWPETRVMIDPRQFPFQSWLDRYGAFHAGRGVREFLRDFPFQVCCVRYECRELVLWFLQAPDWKIAFYGPSAVVFAKREVPIPGTGASRAGKGIEGIRNFTQALFVFEFTTRIQDWQSARRVLADMRERFRCPHHRAEIRAASEWLEKRLAPR
jgi:hypothetical protein